MKNWTKKLLLPILFRLEMYLKEKSAKVRQKIRQKRRTKQETVGKWTWGKAKAEIYLIR